MAAGLGVGLLLDVRLPGLRHVRAAFIVPLVVPTVATALIWGSLFAPQFGLVSRILDGLHVPPVGWLTSPAPALATVLLFGCWQFFGEDVILYLAALKALPSDLLDAAAVDGAGAWQRFIYLRWPLLRRSTALILVVTTLTGLQTFTQIYVLTNGGPNNATTTVLYFIYNAGFVQNNTGQADAMGVVLFFLSLLVTLIQLALVRSVVE
jgi:ABC-type sugar transport system permease subunit